MTSSITLRRSVMRSPILLSTTAGACLASRRATRTIAPNRPMNPAASQPASIGCTRCARRSSTQCTSPPTRLGTTPRGAETTMVLGCSISAPDEAQHIRVAARHMSVATVDTQEQNQPPGFTVEFRSESRSLAEASARFPVGLQATLCDEPLDGHCEVALPGLSESLRTVDGHPRRAALPQGVTRSGCRSPAFA
jgi:hypothetical protein